MKSVHNALHRLAELALLVALILFVVFAMRTMEAPGSADQTLQQPGEAGLTPEVAAGTPYVAPYQDLSQPTPVVVVLGTPEPTPTPWEPDGSMAYPAPPLAPTFTPFPSPTLRPGPTDTPLPLVASAQDASGVIRYLVAGEAGSASLVSLPVDALGMAKSASEQQLLSTSILLNQVGHTSPDGRYLAVLSYWEGGFSGSLIDTRTGKSIPFSENANQENFYYWFPDGQHILIRANYGSLWLADPATGEYVVLAVPDFGGIYGGAVSPDGKLVVYSYYRGVDSPFTQVRIVNSDGRDDHLVIETNSPPAYFAWSPDGKKIAFLEDGWMVMSADGSYLRPLIHLAPPGCHNNPIIWSPDSRRLAIVHVTERIPCTEESAKSHQNSDIYLVDVESGEARPLLKDGILGNYDPAWSPDGKQVAFVSTRSGAPELWVVNVDGSDLRQMTSAGLPVRFPFWSSQ